MLNSWYFSRNSAGRREWQDIFKELKGKHLQPRLLYPARISFKSDGEIESFSKKQKLREFSTIKPEQNKLWKILKEMGIPDHLTCLLRNIYAGQEATVRTGHGSTDWFQIGNGVHQAVYCHPTYLTYMQITSRETLAGRSTSWNQDCWEKYQ